MTWRRAIAYFAAGGVGATLGTLAAVLVLDELIKRSIRL